MRKYARFECNFRRSRSFDRVLITFLAAFCAGFSAFPQTAPADTFRAIPPVTIRDSRFSQTGYREWKADSLPAGGVLSLTDRLQWENPLTVRPNAPGNLATLSARGMGPAHTPVFWNGLNLQSPMNGTADASLVLLWPGDQVELRYGGQSAAQSSGAMGGSVLVTSDCNANRGFSAILGADAGSFGNRQGLAAVGWGNEHIQSTLRGQVQAADNDFPFINTTLPGHPLVRQANNRQDQWNIEQINRFAFGDRHLIKTAFWTLGAFRAIPPLMTAAPKDTWQRDAATRAVVTWEYSPATRSLLTTRAAWLNERILFHLPGITDSNFSQTALLSSEFTTVLARRLIVRAGGSATMQRARVSGYAEPEHWYRQDRLAAFGSVEWLAGRWSVSGMIRQEWAIREARPFTWSAGAQCNAGKAGRFHGHVSSNFNLPTFNDRFWKAWGSPDLLPEKGLSADAGWMVPGKHFSCDATVFHARIDEWILWQPGSDGIFRPGNLRRVWSRGLELSATAKGRMGSWPGSLEARYQLVRTTSTAVYTADQAALYKQLPYIPVHTGSITARVRNKHFSAAYLHQLTGVRFSTTDNSRTVPGYQTGNLLLQYTWQPGRHLVVIFNARMENCWDSRWQCFDFQPMPGRSWHAGIILRS
jgi:iron complex outermembrane receptor protein